MEIIRKWNDYRFAEPIKSLENFWILLCVPVFLEHNRDLAISTFAMIWLVNVASDSCCTNILITVIIIIWIRSSRTRTKKKREEVKAKIFEHIRVILFVARCICVSVCSRRSLAPLSLSFSFFALCVCVSVPLCRWLYVFLFSFRFELSVLGWIVASNAAAAFLMWEMYLSVAVCCFRFFNASVDCYNIEFPP